MIDEKRFTEMYAKEKLSYDEIAKYFCISTSSVYRYVKLFKLTSRRKDVKDLTGLMFGKLKVLRYLSSGRYRYYDQKNGTYQNGGKYDLWECQCECGRKVSIRNGNLHKGHSTGCRMCAAELTSVKLKQLPIDYSVWFRITERCKKKGLELTVTPDDLYQLYLQQNGKCALTGTEIEFGKRRKDKTTASPDRIDTSKGYVQGNIRWVHKYVNSMRNSMPDNVFVDWCKKVVDYSTLHQQGSSL